MRTIVAALLLVTLAGATAADACTTFCSRGLFGRNYDFEIGYGQVIVNKRGTSKTAQRERAASWTSRYGSVTFNQFGRDSATGGMNEKGLVVELMWLDGTRYPDTDTRSEVGTLEWIQYQLDTASSVAEVIASDANVRISASGAPLHYLIADASGDTAAIEFLGGKMVVHRGASVLANDPYTASVGMLKRGAMDRFARATGGLSGATTIAGAFALLDEVAQPHTQWSIVYDINARSVYWKTAKNRTQRGSSLASFDFSCATPVQVADIDGGPFRDYTREQNAALVRRSVRGTSFLKGTPDAKIEESARWPERSACAR
ncbi:MAG TPA: linear amide C-N hydrolase [Thermoanaerobaculia bacterium]|nr:linear amide C-N hydrolase [Thermoanaerobaculia bacterium]